MVAIRPLQWSDFEGLTNLYYERFEEYERDPEFGLSIPPTKPSLGEEATFFGGVHKRILDGDTLVLVAEEGGKMVGVVSVERRASVSDERHAGILGIHVAQGWRGKGIGRALMTEVLRACKGKFEVVELTVMGQNERAQSLYQRLGFRETGREPRAHKRGDRYFDRVRMWRPVD